MDEQRILAGALTGLIVGLTGVGGGALMTPILLLVFGTAPLTAIGTDLWFAAITKLVITGIHQRAGLIDWQIVRRLWAGSLTASSVMLIVLTTQPVTTGGVRVLSAAVAFAVSLSAVGMLFQKKLHAIGSRLYQHAVGFRRWQSAATVAAGVFLGLLVTVTSVGAGALGAICLLYLYPTRLTTPRLIATDVAHAIPLALFAGAGHLMIGNVDGTLLRDLLVGSVPAATLGAALSSRLPHVWLRWGLATVLLVISIKLFAGLVGVQ